MSKILSEEAVVIDFPKQGEKVLSSRYTFRLGTLASAKGVEVSIDEGAWQFCRPAVGYWWYDWAGYKSGRHELVCRVELKDGHIYKSKPRAFAVELKNPVKSALAGAAR